MATQQVWDTRFLALADTIAQWSHDPHTHVGCIIVGPSKEIRSTGFNGLPRGTDDTAAHRKARPEKYFWMEHAERNAIYHAARIGVSLLGCTLYVPWYPCMDCARAIVQVGLTTLVCKEPAFEDPRWGEDFKRARELFAEVGLQVRYVA